MAFSCISNTRCEINNQIRGSVVEMAFALLFAVGRLHSASKMPIVSILFVVFDRFPD